jgi:1,4-dihydroxy-2-naphthoate octaprenyltransferase
VLAALAGAWALVRLGRPVFLTGGMVLYALGAVAAARGHAIERGLLVLGLGAVLALQLMTHYANEYFDYRADLANRTPTRWSGGSRVLAAGELPRWVALAAALMAAGAGLVLTLTVAQAAGPLPATLLAAIALLAWCYSAPPLRLHSTGLGELDGALVVAVLVPLFAFFLHAPNGGPRPLLLALVPPACLQFAMLVAVAIPDAASDAAAGKRTLAVRLGIRRAWQVHASATLAAYALLPFLHAAGLPARVALAAALPAPLALWHVASRRDGRALDPESWESLTFWSAALLALTAAAEAVGFLG